MAMLNQHSIGAPAQCGFQSRKYVTQNARRMISRCSRFGATRGVSRVSWSSLSTAASAGEVEPSVGQHSTADSVLPPSSPEESVGSWFARCISVIGCGALLSKVLGLFREQLISSYLGLTGLADAFNLASTFPVLCLTGIGGLNGALHSATASTSAQLPQGNRKTGDRRSEISLLDFVLVSNTRLGVATLTFSLLLAVAAHPAVRIIAPGLPQQHHAAAVIMLRIMSPVLILSGWIGVGLGALISQKRIFAPSIVPVVGNTAFIAIMLLSAPHIGAASSPFCAYFFVVATFLQHWSADDAGPVQLGLASLGSAVAQWILLSGAMAHAGFPFRMRWGGQAAGRLFHQLLGTASPVLFTTCALHGAAWTDLAVASYIPGAAASMSYAYILGLAPYGIIAGSVLTPLLRSLSMSPEKEQLQLLQVTMSSLARITIPLAVLISTLAPHLVTLALSGGVFAAAEVSIVAQLLPLVQASAVFGVFRDVLMRVHYVRGTGWRMLQLHMFLLAANLALDVVALWLGLEAYGLLASTVLMNLSACGLVWHAIGGSSEKARAMLAFLRSVLSTGVLAAISWCFARWAFPAVLDVMQSCLGGLPASGLAEPISKATAAAACAAFSVPMVVSYLLLYAVFYICFER